MPEAVQCGLRAQLAGGLYQDEHSLGGLNQYSTSSDEIDDDAVDIAERFAAQAAIALGRRRHDSQMSHAPPTRKTIGQAIGIVQERYALNEERAFHPGPSTSNLKLRDVAAELVRTTNERAAGPLNQSIPLP